MEIAFISSGRTISIRLPDDNLAVWLICLQRRSGPNAPRSSTQSPTSAPNVRQPCASHSANEPWTDLLRRLSGGH